MSASVAVEGTSTPVLAELVAGVRSVLRRKLATEVTAELVADQLREHLPKPEVLTPAQRVGHPKRYRQHVLHVEPDGCFSIVALVWLPGQETPIHDHVSWCVVGVVEGVEYETLFALRQGQGETYLVELGTSENKAGSVCGFVPPGDIHRVRNVCSSTAISIHIYGADISRLGSSIRRSYGLDIRPETSQPHTG